ncbi:MAG: GHKL domain-containing protein [Clostridiales bacterium]|nr:GHKL domain-containing protein [Clostridiales bacterium]
MNLFETTILSASEYIMILCIVHGVMDRFRSKAVDKVMYIAVTAVIIGLLDTYLKYEVVSNTLGNIINYIFLMIYLRKNEQKEMVSNTIIFFFSYILIVAVQLFVIILLSNVMSSFEISFKFGLIAQGLGLTLIFLGMKFLSVGIINRLIVQKNTVFRMVVVTVFSVHYFLIVLWYLDSGNIFDNTIGILIIVLLTVAINALIIRSALIGKVYEEKVKLYDTFFPVIDTMIDEFRKNQHDFENHIQTIKSMKREEFEQEDSIERYIDGIREGDVLDGIIEVENKILAAFLYSKYLEVLEKGVEIKFSIKGTLSNSVYGDHELVEIFGILIDNAVEATLEYDKLKAIEVLIKREKGINILEVRNSFRFIGVNELGMFFKLGYSTKGDIGRGVGLHKLKKLIERKKGTLSAQYDDSTEEVVVTAVYY